MPPRVLASGPKPCGAIIILTSDSSHYICPRVGYDVFYAMNCTILISKYVYFFFACRLLN